MKTTTPLISTNPRSFRTRALGALCATLGLAAIAASPAAAAPHVDGKFDVSGVGPNNELTKGPDGNIWVTLDQTNDVARITPNGTVTEFNPTSVTNPVGITTGPDGNIWVTQNGGVASFSPDDPDAAVKYPIGDIMDARQIVTGPDGNLWTVSGENVIRIPAVNPAGSTSFPVLVAGRDIDAGKDGLKGQVAYADPISNPQKVGRITTGGKAKKTAAPGDPFGVAFGADKAYWIPRFAGVAAGD